jgi:hypothetical protein
MFHELTQSQRARRAHQEMRLQENLALGAEFRDEPCQLKIGIEERAKQTIERLLAI